jgi:hypothetical protein
MNYLKVYCNLIRKAEKRGYTKKKAKEQGLYVEGHHTFPVSIFGKNKRIVYLTAREHYIAHALLVKICISRYELYHWKSKKMIYAFWGMNNQENNLQQRYFNSKIYESARIKYINISKEFRHNKDSLRKLKQSLKNLGEKHPSKKPESRERKRKLLLEHNPMSNPNSVEKLCRFKYELIDPNGNIFIVNNLRKFCRENKLGHSSFFALLAGRLSYYKGWSIKKLSEIKT